MPSTSKPQLCPKNWIRWGNKCYSRDSLWGTFEERLHHCRVLGATILTIESSEENQFIYDTFFGTELWLGAKRLQDHSFIWIETGEYLKYTQWHQGEPNNNNGNENCVEFYQGSWNDKNCDSMNRGVCQKLILL
ncbi:perlucin-like protein [Leptotrombidium deliense]|uniref:Perlucin-like protein n=1 Tax=Leptotrombidium deliense TaxID=299467 RepID=A0A443RTU0_9ACAR|nr:perlucin-like protein [Leptotrombidium deliense]